jgi:hypothetical protein
MRKTILVVLAFLSGCATLAPVPLTIPETKWVETQPLPADPSTAKVPFSDGDWAVPMDEEECITKDGMPVADAPKPCPGKGGILVSEEKIARLKLFQLDSNQLRQNYAADKLVWAAQRMLYEARLKDAGEAIQKLQPDWFQLHATEIGMLFGMLVGVGTAVGVVYGVVPAFKTLP